MNIKTCVWIVAVVLVTVFVVLFKSILLPFVLGAGIAYLLNPLVNKLGQKKINRGTAALVILLGFIVVVGGILAVLVPMIYNQAVNLLNELPQYVDNIASIWSDVAARFQGLIGYGENVDLGALVQNNAGKGAQVTGTVLAGIAAGGLALVSTISLLVITPIVAFFMMKEWPTITKEAEDLMPRDSKPAIMQILNDINKKLAGFVRGQLTVCMVLGLGYAIALSIAGLKYGFLIGLGAGLFSIIPYIGSTLGLLTSVTVAWFQNGEWSFVAIIAGIFLIGQFLEGNFITPKLVGDSVGLHPLWVFFAVMAGGSLLGIVGMILAVPVAAIASVLVAFVIKRYKASRYYKEG